jgi:hypothetical protein
MNRVRTLELAQYGATNLHPLVIVFMICMTALALAPKRSAVTFAVLAVCVFMPMEQRVVIGGLDFSMLRLIMIVAWIRVVVKGEYRGFRMGKLDWLFLFWVFSASLFYVLRVGPSGIVYRLGVSFDSLTAFFLIRMLVRTRGEVLVLWRHLAWVVVVLSPLFLYEAIALHNAFGIFDYAGFDPVEFRDGRPRSQGPFSHPILAGTFGSVAMPVFVAIFWGRRNQRILFGSACVGATIITIASGSSGPIIAWAVGAFGWAIWRFRKHVRPMLWGLVGLAVIIHFAREKPIWHFLLRLSSITGGTGQHRYYLVDAFIRRFHEWALVGTSNTAHWGFGLQDTTNRYVAEGVSGGLMTLVLFIIVLRTSFVQLRRARLVFERQEGPKSLSALLAWGSSVSLAVHCVSFISVSYFGQMVQFFVFFVATVPAIARFSRRQRVKSRRAPLAAKTPTPIPAAHFHSVS